MAFAILSITGLIYQWLSHRRSADSKSMRGILSFNLDTLILVHVKRNCNCAEWIKWSNSINGTEVGKDDYIWLEPANPGLELPEEFSSYPNRDFRLRVEGSYYQDQAIPNDYVPQGDQKPEKARVFRYISSDLIKPE
jgi:hypothetical protein